MLGLLCVSTAIGGRKDQAAESRAKARHFYLKGAVSEAEGDNVKAYEYYKKAYRVDPTYGEASYAYGSQRMLLNTDTFTTDTELFRNLRDMQAYVDAYPGDVVAGEEYAYYAAACDTIPESIRVTERLVKLHPGISRLYLPLSYYYKISGETEKAVQALREYERLEGATSETLLRKISYYIAESDTAAAIAETDAYVVANPGPDPLLSKAMIYNILGRPDDAINILEGALAEYPHNGEMKYNIAVMYAERGDTARFHQLIYDAFRSPEMEYEDKMALLRGYLQNLPLKAEDYTESESLFALANETYGDDPVFLEIYADFEISKGDFPAAFDKLKLALKQEHDNPYLLKRLVSLSIVADRPREGMKIFEDFPDEEAKQEFDVILPYVSAAQVLKDYDTAIDWTGKLLKAAAPGLSLQDTIAPDSWVDLIMNDAISHLFSASLAYEVAGDLYAASGRNDDAVRSYENALALEDYENPSTLNNYAYYIVEKLKADPESPEFEKAKEMSRKSLELTESEPVATYLDTYAWILFKERNYKEALDYQELAIEKMGDDVSYEIYDHYGDILFMNGRPDEALKQWKAALELDPTNALIKKKVEHKTFFYE